MATRVEIMTISDANGACGRRLETTHLPTDEVLRVAADCGIVSQTCDAHGPMVSVEAVSRANLKRLVTKLRPFAIA